MDTKRKYSQYLDRKRGRMTDDEKREIERLCARMARPTPGIIANKLKRHPATIAWYMITHGLISRPLVYGRPVSFRANGVPLNPYTPAQDRRLEELRCSGKNYRQIAEALTAEFGIRRNQHSVQVRCKMLAAYDAPGHAA